MQRLKSVPVACLLLSLVLEAAVLHVPGDHATIQQAVDAGLAGDTVLVANGHWHERIVLPPMDMTLASPWLLSQDPADIEATILDGDSLGTVVTVPDGAQRTRVCGFTIRHGLGGWDGHQYVGGGAFLVGGQHVQLDGMVFKDCYAQFTGCAFSTPTHVTGPDTLVLQEVEVDLDVEHPPHAGNYSFVEVGSMLRTEVTEFRVTGGASGGGAMLSSEGELLARGIRVEDCGAGRALQLRADTLFVRDLDVTSSTVFAPLDSWSVGTCVGMIATSHIDMRRIRVVGNSLDVEESSGQFLFASSRTVMVDSLVFRDNTSRGGLCAGTIWANRTGEISRLEIVGNSAGGLGDAIDSDENQQGHFLSVKRCSIRDFQIENNESWLHENVFWNGVLPGLLLNWTGATSSVGDTTGALAPFHLERGRFLDNQVHFRGRELALEGRLLAAVLNGTGESSWMPVELHVEDCEFVDNGMHPVAYDYQMGCVNLENAGDRGRVVMERCLFVSNSAAAISARSHTPVGTLLDLDFHDLVFRDTEQHAIHTGRADSSGTRLRNIWIDGFRSVNWSTGPTFWDLAPLWIKTGQANGAEISNVTMTNCVTPLLFVDPIRTLSDTDSTRNKVRNCLLFGNTIVQVHGPADVGEHHPTRFDWCLLPEAVPVGSNNLIGAAPQFVDLEHVPYLDESSPCVDAGDPDERWNDVEDPERPGSALWPAWGGLRADIGCTGGPAGARVDTNWVSVEPPAGLRPQQPWLSEPWPNPFNPVARLAFELPHPTALKLTVHDLLGRRVATLAEGPHAAGRYVVVLDGSAWASGVYFATLEAAGRSWTVKAALAK